MADRHPQQNQHSDSVRTSSSRSATAVSSSESSALLDPATRSTTSATKSPAQPLFRVPQSPRSATSDSQSKAAKVAIPRLKRSADSNHESATRSGGRHRVNHACEPCRHRKTKCSGERPVCRHCEDFKIVCFYADGKRDRVKKQFGSMTEKVADYEKLLKHLLTRVPEDDAKLIKASLDKAAQIEGDETLSSTATALSIEQDAETETSGAESEASGGAGSTGALDRTDEDFTREGAKITGFMGKQSEVTWMQRVRQENRYDEDSRPGNVDSSRRASKTDSGDNSVPLPEAADGFSVHDASYHLDDLTITTYDTVDPYELPTQETAQLLFNTYMHRVHPSFPIVGQLNLTGQFRRFIANPVQSPPQKWLAIVNLIFAISAKYSHLIQASWRGDERDHMVYFSRARMLGLNNETLFQHPDLQTIQVMGLMSFYLMCVSRINRSWIMIGVAIRGAVGLGLNMRNDSGNLKEPLKEIRYRLWWALYTLEHRLCSITGRTNCVLDDHYTTPLPVPLDEDKFETEEARRMLSKEFQQAERAPSTNSPSPVTRSSTLSHEQSPSTGKSEQSRSPSAILVPSTDLSWARDAPISSSLYFLQFVQLTRLTQTVFNQLYNPAALERTWSFIQGQIKRLNEQLDGWYRRLPASLDFQRKQRDREFYEFRLNLGFFYYSTKQTINRPCLCRLDRKIPNQSSKSRDFNRASATDCVEAAQDMLRLIPDEPNAIGLIRVGPWWYILPYLVQSACVLMLEISFRAHHMPEEADSILGSAKKAIRWLHALGEDNLSARRAWSSCNAMLREAVVKIGRDVSDLPNQAPGRASSLSPGNAISMTGTSPRDESTHFQPDMTNTTMYGLPVSMPAYATFAGYDRLMQYDQYYPPGDVTNAPIDGLTMSQYPHANPSSVGMEFMTNAYNNDQGQHHLGNMPGGNDMSGTGSSYIP